ncbi:LuxR C-terminal-related transcriptional regulator [Rhodococcus jostii]|uniref:ATP-, maltotriose-and DNA-dependent transcriptional regulator MalT n=1 Tax=Rhodococcus jostii TaxID=132919 RepID=A0A1H4J6V6_RHOJO|nr:LuxR family transcriptional regulator [Rhodococcus jostii]SEB42030.1 ATP-, maltotriose-and DNA-dependent transcriptional regulator MalT [Rhodococcus jostii]
MFSTADRWPLVGREEELHLINATITGTGRHGGILIAGPAGVGKSRLAREAITGVRPGRWVPRWARATASARVLPLGAFAEWIDGGTADTMSVVRGVIDHVATCPPGGKVVVGVDDAHLLDDLSAFVVLQLVQRQLAPVVVTIRTGEPVPDAVTTLWKDGHLQRIELQPLSEEETGELVTAVVGGQLDPYAVRRLWNVTRGNTLYLRHLVEQELASERLAPRREAPGLSAGAWVWDGPPTASPGLADLISAQLDALPPAVGAVLDVLAVGEPLPVQMLAELADSDAVEDAHALGLITVDRCGRHPVRLAHPLYGEARRARVTPLRLRRLQAEVAEALGHVDDVEVRDLVRRAVLILESGLPAAPGFLAEAATAALSLFDVELAVRLCKAAISNGAGYDVHVILSVALMQLSRGEEVEQVLTQLLAQPLSDEQIVDVTDLRIGNLLWILNRPEEAESALLGAREATAPRVHGALTAGQAIIHAYHARPLDAVEAARSALRAPDLPELSGMWALGALLIALGDMGRASEIAPIAARVYDLLSRSTRVSVVRLHFSEFHTRGLRMAGYVQEAADVTTRICAEVADVPGWAQGFSAILTGLAELPAGNLDAARKWLEQRFTTGIPVGYIPTIWYCALAQAQAMSGDATNAAQTLHALDAWGSTTIPYLKPEYLLTKAWVSAAAGAVTEAIALAHHGALCAAEHHQHAHEVMCLHTATRLGDTTTAHRLHELAKQMDGPRAPAAALHAAALAAGDADGLLEASQQFEKIGDPLSAMDAAAHAATTFRHHGRNGSALTAADRAQRLADACDGADTPALREAQQPSPLTARQREVITLVAQGLSNKQIAEKMTLSVRTVEGHLHRAALKTGVSGRDNLGAIVTGDQPPPDRGHQLE